MQSTFAPASRSTKWPVNEGIMAAMAGLSTPGTFPRRYSAVAIATPECPALTAASAFPVFTSYTALRIEESFFFLRTATGDSSIPATSEA